MDIPGRVALVTGGAHRVGRGIALALAEEGADVYVHYGSSANQAEEAVAEIKGLGRHAWCFAADLGVPDEIDALFQDLRQRAGRLDILVNNAARFDSQALAKIDVEDWQASMDVNLRAPFLCARAAAEIMRASDDEPEAGVIVNIADLSGQFAWRDLVQHGVSKAGLLHLTDVLAREMAPRVRVNAIVPGAILPPPGMDQQDFAWRKIIERLPLMRAGSPELVGQTVVFLARNAFMTGAVIHVDGGEHLLGPAWH